MSTCCSVCSSVNQIGSETVSVCMECATVATPFMSIPVGLIFLSVAVLAVASAVAKRFSKISFIGFTKNILKA